MSEFDEQGRYLSTSFSRQRFALGHGRQVAQVFASGSDTLLYDTTAAFLAKGQEGRVPFTAVATDGGTVLVSRNAPVRQTGAAHLQTTSETDAFGHTGTAEDLGCVEGCPLGTKDEVLTKTTETSLVSGDESGWLYRPMRSYVTGSIHKAIRGDTATSYDALGRPTGTSSVLSGTEALDRSHAEGKSVAAAPVNASKDGTIETGPITYDALGNATRTEAPNGRCAAVAYDELRTRSFP